GEVQIREEHLALLEHGAFLQLRLFDFDDELGFLEHFFRGGENLRAARFIVRVVQADARAGIMLNEYFVARGGQLPYAGWREPDAILMNLNFFRTTDAHARLRENEFEGAED